MTDYYESKKMLGGMVQGVEACMGREAFASAATLIFAYIETLGGFYAGKKAGKENFVKFTQQYMSVSHKLAEETGKSLEDSSAFLYKKFRHGFVHQYLSKAGTGITRGAPYVSLKEGYVVIDIHELSADFKNALDKYSKDIEQNIDNLGDNYDKRVIQIRSAGRELFIKLSDSIEITDTLETPNIT